jgi:hypothetical protein
MTLLEIAVISRNTRDFSKTRDFLKRSDFLGKEMLDYFQPRRLAEIVWRLEQKNENFSLSDEDISETL